MPTPRSGQLHEISQAIGGLQASVSGIERYIHDKQHEENGVSQKIDALGHRIGKDITAVEGRIEGRIRAMDERLIALELSAAGDSRTRSIVAVVVQSPLIGWIAGVIAFVWAMATHGGHK